MHPLRHPLFIRFIIHFNYEADYFECHEVGEDYWKQIAPKDKTHPLTGWIQVAVGMYHWRRSNYPGALRSFIRAKPKLTDAGVWTEGFDADALIQQIGMAIEAVTKREEFQPFELPLIGEELTKEVETMLSAYTLTEDDAYYLMHKHRLRDRSSIISLREQNKRKNFDKF